MKQTHILLLMLCFLVISLHAQKKKEQNWDDTQNKNWGSDFKIVNIPSSVDGEIQKAYFYSSLSVEKRPLIVSLHTWSGDYTQEDPLARLMVEYDYNYIHPDFRGPNYTPEACGSEYVVADLEDAIAYAIANMNVDPNEVHIVGASGGGYATLVAYMNVKYPIKSFSAWVPLSNLENWYWESVGRKQHYKDHILKATGSTSELNVAESRKRSPYFQKYPADLRKNAKLYIYAGIHDGYQGSVPITQSIDMYNKIAKESFEASDDELISDQDKLTLVVKRCFPSHDFKMNIGDRKVHYFKKKENVSVSIFEGGHEQIVDQVIPLMPIDKKYELKPKTVLNIGDSNSSFEYSWPQLLSKQTLRLKVHNYGIPGNTVGFDNLGQKRLNTLANIDSLFNQAKKDVTTLDYVIISLGSNDCKAIFDKQQNEAKRNFDKLIKELETSSLTKNSKIIVLSIPPADMTKVSEKYYGMDARILALNDYYRKKITNKKNITFLDTYSLLLPNISTYTEDGVHLNETAQQ